MMRDILFRAKALHNNEWVYGDYLTIITNEGRKRHYIKRAEDGLLSPVEIIPETLGQATGLFDSNGKIIFENDIVRCKYANTPVNEHIQKVVFLDGKFVAEFSRGGCYSGLYDGAKHFDFDKSVYMTEIEKIGNTTDSPELLRGDEE